MKLYKNVPFDLASLPSIFMKRQVISSEFDKLI